MNPRCELMALQKRSETLCVQTAERLIFNIWTQADGLDFVRDWSRVIVPGIGHDDYWPVGTTISGDMLFVEKEESLFAMLHDELEIRFLSMTLSEFLRRLMEKQEDLDESLFESSIESSDPRYQFVKSTTYAEAVAELRAEMDQFAKHNSFQRPEMSREELTELLRKYGIVNLTGNSDL